MLLDVDYFKSINDNYGHDAGDDVLREVACASAKSIRGIDLACRYGGEEFVIVISETDLHVVGMLRAPAPLDRGRAVRDRQGHAAHRSHDLDWHLDFGEEGGGGGYVLKRVDTPLYRAKHDGRNRLVSQAA